MRCQSSRRNRHIQPSSRPTTRTDEEEPAAEPGEVGAGLRSGRSTGSPRGRARRDLLALPDDRLVLGVAGPMTGATASAAASRACSVRVGLNERVGDDERRDQLGGERPLARRSRPPAICPDRPACVACARRCRAARPARWRRGRARPRPGRPSSAPASAPRASPGRPSVSAGQDGRRAASACSVLGAVSAKAVVDRRRPASRTRELDAGDRRSPSRSCSRRRGRRPCCAASRAAAVWISLTYVVGPRGDDVGRRDVADVDLRGAAGRGRARRSPSGRATSEHRADREPAAGRGG